MASLSGLGSQPGQRVGWVPSPRGLQGEAGLVHTAVEGPPAAGEGKPGSRLCVRISARVWFALVSWTKASGKAQPESAWVGMTQGPFCTVSTGGKRCQDIRAVCFHAGSSERQASCDGVQGRELGERNGGTVENQEI